MLIIGCDYHPGFQQIALVDTDTGELSERRLLHVGNAQTTTRAKWRTSMSAYRSVLENVLDTADIVRDGDVSPTDIA
jgi:hypothetical protein